ncbi:MAG TPA: response regulator [Flavobacteriales bacterium]|nr:response regulator [Flavobacteriales bacterium]MCB0808031.1 response regulator [Flavobacteriales bacterium]HOP44929.1 response regulator [Flavobacteriales bacterium]
MQATAVIVDDEPRFQELIAGLLASRFTNVQLIGRAGSVQEGAELVNATHPDLLFLDVELGKMTGFDLLKRLSPPEPIVVFATAHAGYAVKAIKFNALDYLVKPFDAEEFDEAVTKALRRLEENGRPQRIPGLLGSMVSDRQIALPDAKGLNVLHLDDILHCSSDNAYTNVHVRTEKKPILVTRPLSLFDDYLTDKGFVRIHQSHLVNHKHIKRYIRGEGGEVVLSDDTHLPVSRRMKGQLMEMLERI